MDSTIARRRLEAMLSELDDSSRTLLGEEGDTGELSHLDQHPAEAASELTEQERDDAMLAALRFQREAVVEALSRVEAGTYGRCVECEGALPEERLDARPEAARCMTCQQKLEAAS